jgi:hypothetical protein
VPVLQFPSDRVVGILDWAGSYTEERGPVLATGAVSAPDGRDLRLSVEPISHTERAGNGWTINHSVDGAVDLEFLRSLPPAAIGSLSVRAATESSAAAITHLAPGLRTLTLPWSGFSDAVLPAVARLTELTFLQTFGNRFTDAGVQQLVTLQQLESLYLEEETLGIAAFDFVDRLPALQRLGLQDVALGPGDLERLKRRLPGVRVD